MDNVDAVVPLEEDVSVLQDADHAPMQPRERNVVYCVFYQQKSKRQTVIVVFDVLE